MLDKVAKSLVAWQREFLDHGLAHLKPLVLRDVTNAIGMHESTVSRVITNRYMSTAHGIVALKSFFPSGTESYGSERLPSLTVKDTQKLVAAEAGLRPQPAWPPGGLRMSPDEEQLVRQAIEEQRARRPHSEPPPRSDSVETSGVPPEDEEPQRRRADEAAESLHQWVEKIYGIEFSRLAADPEVRAAYRDLQMDLARPQLRSAVLLALRAFAQAASAGATTPPPPDAVESVPRLQERPVVEALSSIHDLNDLLHLAITRAVVLLEIESVSIILLDEERQELYFKVADDTSAGHEQRLREVRFPTTQGIAGWVIRESQSLIVPDVDQDPRFYRGIDVHTGTKTRSLICVPLRTQAWIIGVLEAINKRQGHFTAEDVRLLEAFAHELALALENARLIQERYNLDVQQLIADAERLANSTVQFDTLIGESPKM